MLSRIEAPQTSRRTSPVCAAEMQLVDLRVVRDRDGVLRASIDGRRVTGLRAATDVADLLGALGSRIRGCAWTAGRSCDDEIGAADSALYE